MMFTINAALLLRGLSLPSVTTTFLFHPALYHALLLALLPTLVGSKPRAAQVYRSIRTPLLMLYCLVAVLYTEPRYSALLGNSPLVIAFHILMTPLALNLAYLDTPLLLLVRGLMMHSMFATRYVPLLLNRWPRELAMQYGSVMAALQLGTMLVPVLVAARCVERFNTIKQQGKLERHERRREGKVLFGPGWVTSEGLDASSLYISTKMHAPPVHPPVARASYKSRFCRDVVVAQQCKIYGITPQDVSADQVASIRSILLKNLGSEMHEEEGEEEERVEEGEEEDMVVGGNGTRTKRRRAAPPPSSLDPSHKGTLLTASMLNKDRTCDFDIRVALHDGCVVVTPYAIVPRDKKSGGRDASRPRGGGGGGVLWDDEASVASLIKMDACMPRSMGVMVNTTLLSVLLRRLGKELGVLVQPPPPPQSPQSSSPFGTQSDAQRLDAQSAVVTRLRLCAAAVESALIAARPGALILSGMDHDDDYHHGKAARGHRGGTKRILDTITAPWQWLQAWGEGMEQEADSSRQSCIEEHVKEKGSVSCLVRAIVTLPLDRHDDVASMASTMRHVLTNVGPVVSLVSNLRAPEGVSWELVEWQEEESRAALDEEEEEEDNGMGGGGGGRVVVVRGVMGAPRGMAPSSTTRTRTPPAAQGMQIWHNATQQPVCLSHVTSIQHVLTWRVSLPRARLEEKRSFDALRIALGLFDHQAPPPPPTTLSIAPSSSCREVDYVFMKPSPLLIPLVSNHDAHQASLLACELRNHAALVPDLVSLWEVVHGGRERHESGGESYRVQGAGWRDATRHLLRFCDKAGLSSVARLVEKEVWLPLSVDGTTSGEEELEKEAAYEMCRDGWRRAKSRVCTAWGKGEEGGLFSGWGGWWRRATVTSSSLQDELASSPSSPPLVPTTDETNVALPLDIFISTRWSALCVATRRRATLLSTYLWLVTSCFLVVGIVSWARSISSMERLSADPSLAGQEKVKGARWFDFLLLQGGLLLVVMLPTLFFGRRGPIVEQLDERRVSADTSEEGSFHIRQDDRLRYRTNTLHTQQY